MTGNAQTHQIVVNAYGHETDHQCRVTPQSYLRYMDRGRLDAFEEICQGLGVKSWLETYIINVYKITARFAAPAYNGERLVVNSSLHKTSSHRAVFLQRVLNSRGAIAAEAFVELLFLDAETKQLVPIPEQLPASSLPAIANERVLVPVPFNNQDHFKFQWPIRVYYEDTDAQQITYHVSYFNFCERAFLEYVRQCVGEGTFRGWLGTHQIRMVRQINRYMKATHLSDHLTILLGLRALDETSLLLDERVINAAGEVCTDMMSEIQILENGQVIPVPVSLGLHRL